VIAIGLHHGLAIRVPVAFRQLAEVVDDVERPQVLFRIGLAHQRLHLHQRLLVVDLDRAIDRGQPQVDEQRTEPAVRFENALVALERLAARQV
jgi:hypothetical protein